MISPLSWKAAALLLVCATASFPAAVTEPTTGIALTVNASGDYTVESADPPFQFGGALQTTLTDLAIGGGADSIGPYQEIAFRYSREGARAAGIRVYAGKPIVLFSVRYLEPGPNLAPFPGLTTYPRNLFHLAYDGIFGNARFDLLAADSPWVFFDSDLRTFVLSPASHLAIANTTQRAATGIESGVNPAIATLPQDFQFDTILVVGRGLNKTLDTWGRALTDLGGKNRPANDADMMLSRLGYWTDNGSAYYYRFESSLGYTGTLQRVKDEFARQGVPLGYMQLDSWFYPKGGAARWEDSTGGIYRYEADARLFPSGLKNFQDSLGIPLIAHGRWIDANSPYRLMYRMSNNVSTDMNYWDTVADYLRSSGVVSYEQDWLGADAQASLNLNDREDFLRNMARSEKLRSLTIQYCMPLPRHFLQSSALDNVTVIRTSDDRFSRARWDKFLFGSKFASTLGLWPWSDVFMSYEPDNLLVSTLSAGPVGVGDRIADINAANLLRAVRADGVIVKPDAPLVPVDETYLGDARGDGLPMVASTYTVFGQSRALYVFAYQRAANNSVSFTPAALGVSGQVYIYDYFKQTGSVADAAKTYRDNLGDRGYYIVAPIGPSGIALLGDAGHYVSLGRKRVTSLKDDGVIEATVAFAPGEAARVLFGYSPSAPVVTAISGSADPPLYDESSHLFRVSVTPGVDGSAVINIR